MEDAEDKVLEEVVNAIYKELQQSNSVNSQDLLHKYNLKIPHSRIFEKLNNLQAKEQLRYEIVIGNKYTLTDEAIQNDYLNIGTPEMQVWRITSAFPDGKLLNLLQKENAKLFKDGLTPALQNNWVRLEKQKDPQNKQGPILFPIVSSPPNDVTFDQLVLVHKGLGNQLSKETIDALKKRKFITQISYRTFDIFRGEKFSANWITSVDDITTEMLKGESWENLRLRDFNLDVKTRISILHRRTTLHPTIKFLTVCKQNLLEMGFSEVLSLPLEISLNTVYEQFPYKLQETHGKFLGKCFSLERMYNKQEEFFLCFTFCSSLAFVLNDMNLFLERIGFILLCASLIQDFPAIRVRGGIYWNDDAITVLQVQTADKEIIGHIAGVPRDDQTAYTVMLSVSSICKSLYPAANYVGHEVEIKKILKSKLIL